MINFPQKRNSFVFMKAPFIFFILISLSVSFSSFGQTKNQLENKRIKLRKEIQQAQKLLFKSQQEEETLLLEIEDINKVISARSKLIRTINQEEKKLSNEISSNQLQISNLEESLIKLKKEYANMIVQSYKSKSKRSTLMFLLSSENFSQAYKRLQYIKQYSNYRKLQGEEIKHKQVELGILTDSLIVKQEEKILLIALHIKEQDSVKHEKNSQQRLIQKVKDKEHKYITQIKRKQRQENRIDKQIQRLITEAIAKSNKKGNKRSTKFKLTPEEKKLETTFVANKGKLPWPIKKGIVVRKFGKQKHPTLAGITIQSNGIQVATEKKAKARSIFNGTVLSIHLLPGRKKMVLVQHGNYISAYKNLDNVLVKKGQKITTGQNIGTIHTDATTGRTVLAFSLFKETVIQNPEPWIGKML